MILSKKTLVMGKKAPQPSSIQEVLEEKVDSLAASTLSLNQESLQDIQRELTKCQRCRLHEKRTHLVFGEGNIQSPLVVVGEAPGEQEDLQGRPFVGRAGQLLTKMLEAIGLSRDQIYITNVIKSRPPQNRPPEPDEIAACAPFLVRQLKVIRPRVILAMGRVSAQFFFQTSERISLLRGKSLPYFCGEGIDTKVIATFHPAYLLRNPAAKKEAWEDLKRVAQELGLPLPPRGLTSPGVIPGSLAKTENPQQLSPLSGVDSPFIPEIQ